MLWFDTCNSETFLALKVYPPPRRKRRRRKHDIQHPMLTIVDMATFLLNSETYSEKLLNRPVSDVSGWKHDLALFWEKWRTVEPSNQVFATHGHCLDHCIPCMLHGDEGTGHRKKPLFQLSWGSLLRIGKNSLERMFLITSCAHKMYSKYNKGSVAGNIVIDRLLGECAKSASKAGVNGIQTRSGHKFYLVFLGLAGDHPFQTKAYRATRGHLKVDICPHCHANTYSVPFEDMSRQALWRFSIFQSLPWKRGVSPPLLSIPGAGHPSFIRWDLMHMLPHGCARNFAASVICMMAGPLEIFIPETSDGRVRNSKEQRLDVAYDYFQSWLDCNRKHVRDMKEFTPENLGWEQNRSYPEMTCKASDCNLIIQWLIDFLTSIPFQRSWELEISLSGLEGVDEFLRLSYTGDRVFWDPEKQKRGKACLGVFLHAYVELQRYWYNKGWTLFKIVPKLHYSAHWHEELVQALGQGQAWSISPGAFATPILEDFIGVVSRIGRTSHPSSVPRTTIYKYLVEIRKVWAASTAKWKKGVVGMCFAGVSSRRVRFEVVGFHPDFLWARFFVRNKDSWSLLKAKKRNYIGGSRYV